MTRPTRILIILLCCAGVAGLGRADSHRYAVVIAVLAGVAAWHLTGLGRRRS